MRILRAIFLLPGLLVGCDWLPQPLPAPPAATPAVRTRSAGPTLDGRPFDLWQDRDAAATVLVFVRTDCPVSNRYAPVLRDLSEAYGPRRVDFFLVYVDPRETPDSVAGHRREYQLPCPGVLDPQHRLVAMSGATVTPEAAVFDARRELAYCGRIDDLFPDFGESRTEATTHELADALDAVLAGQAVAQSRTRAVGCYIGDLR